jgi:TetR/AcrR family transcriptional regulator
MTVEIGTTRPSRAKAERTRTMILDAAERAFAESGYAAARLEDIASRVGIRRASLIYYFRDKRDLYDTVLTGIFEELLDRYRPILASRAPLRQRIEAVIDAWVGYVGERPTVARLLLWEVGDGTRQRTAAAAESGATVIGALVGAIREGQREGIFQPIDPVPLIVTLIGATVFFVTGTPHLVPEWPFDPLSPTQLAAHRAALLGITRRLLGTAGAPRAERPSRRIRPASPPRRHAPTPNERSAS